MSGAEDWRQRFESFCARKTQAARTAAIAPYVTDLEHPDEGMEPLANHWTAPLFDGPFYVSSATDAGRPTCSLVFVQSADGNTGASDPGTLGGGDTDKHLIYEGLSRVAADAVLAGAETVGPSVFFTIKHPQIVALRNELH